MYLLDTNVLSELRKPKPDDSVLKWFAEVPREQVFVPAVAVGEIQAGIELRRERNSVEADEIEAWLAGVRASYSLLPMDADAFVAWARLMHKKPDGLSFDAMIAAVAIVNRLQVVSRNTRHFAQLGLDALNPFDGEQG